ncbi:2-methylfumaryl-CoA isomerase [Roseivivax lentus]|uniref:2-methylfumaryl-CoA isomerase n=1 Tax=Roseivivax lentus TaxID=633194 RepID=A0A1N7PQS3_9RHOB|nr:CoA transferase [Roseivivax lentus]SIT12789.1 2-methylfumaryl-CoA isomerase [Roseivivax lentus]
MSGILNGMRVIEGSAFVAVPLAGLTLAQMGAEVIRFDRLEGGLDATRWPVAPSGRSHFWAGLNKGKKSVAIDMRAPEGRELITRLITAPGEDAGLFITNLAVKGWLDHETLSGIRPDLVSVTLTGDRHGRPQVDYTVNPALGIPDMTGPEGSDAPVAHALPAWDVAAGGHVVNALLAAERHRLRHGAGQGVTLALKDIAAATIGHLGMIGEAATTGRARAKCGNALYGAYGQDFLCADGKRVMVIGLTERQWQGLVKVTGTQEAMERLFRSTGQNLSDEGVRFRMRHDLTGILAPWFAARPRGMVAKALDAAGVTWAPFRNVVEALAEDPDLGPDNPMFSVLDQPGLGRFPVPGNPARYTGFARETPAIAPELGAHTESVLSEVGGLDATEIQGLFDRGIVGDTTRMRCRSAA